MSHSDEKPDVTGHLPVVEERSEERAERRRGPERAASRGTSDASARDRQEPWEAGRRDFLKLVGSTIAVPSLAACTRQPPEKIIPYVRQPEEIIPGKPLFYASASVLGGVGLGTLVEAHMGRPTKIEGNPEHPTSLGATDIYAQAEILQLYDPERSRTVMHNGQISSWGALVGALQKAMTNQRSKYGVGLRIVTTDTSSPTLIEQMRQLIDELPQARWHILEPAGRANQYAATKTLFGDPLDVQIDFAKADVVLSLDSDFLGSAEGDTRQIGAYAARRKRGATDGAINRLYVVESSMTLTGANADHRAPVKASEVEHVARELAKRLMPGRAGELGESKLPGILHAKTLDIVSADLARAGANAVVVAGRYQPKAVHMLAAAINDHLGSRAISYTDPILASGNEPVLPIADLVTALNNGQVELLVMVGSVNPAYAAPGDLDVASAIEKAKLRVHHGTHFDETAALCHWHIPATHPLEAWGDVRSSDGTITVIQPLIEPLYGAKSEHEILAALSPSPDRTGYEIVRDGWSKAFAGPEFELTWSATLHDGMLANSERTRKKPGLTEGNFPPTAKPNPGLEVVVRPDPCVYDGRYSNNAWLQEVPKPLTKLTWDNAALMSPATAQSHGVEDEDVVELTVAGGRKARAAVFVVHGVPADVVVAHLGYGRERVGEVGRKRGFSAYDLTTTKAPFHGPVTLTKTGDKYDLASAQLHHSMEGRDLVRSAPSAVYRKDRQHFKHKEHKRLSLYPPHDYPGYSWGMSIDLSSCIGCSACVVACQAENNIGVVGKEEVMIGRELHWIRIDRYFDGDPVNPTTSFQPVPCMHCENAPCEVVCPVAATAHHDEGLNDMVYNRCVGTKYCSNNCPYKVRRFNFFGYSHEKIAPMDPTAPSVKMSHNPDVTVRYYGVMEKCSYCVQRINHARIEAKNGDRRIEDGDVMTACQAACPAQAISFGNINDKSSVVSKQKAEPRNYSILAELNTEPRTTYLAKLTNPNPALKPADEKKEAHGKGH